jgi:hypothetical protein
MDANQQYDSATIAILRRAFDDVFSDPRYFDRRSTSALEIAEHLWPRPLSASAISIG